MSGGGGAEAWRDVGCVWGGWRVAAEVQREFTRRSQEIREVELPARKDISDIQGGTSKLLLVIHERGSDLLLFVMLKNCMLVRQQAADIGGLHFQRLFVQSISCLGEAQ